MQGTKSTFFTAQNASLRCLQQTVHFMLATNIFSTLPPAARDKMDEA